MRFMVIVHAPAASEAGATPDEELLAAMGRYNAELVRAGVMLDGAGLQPSSKGARIHFRGDETTVIDGPFAQGTELVAAYSVLQVSSREEAIEWARRMPNPYGAGAEGEIEVRQLFENFGPGQPNETPSRGSGFATPE